MTEGYNGASSLKGHRPVGKTEGLAGETRTLTGAAEESDPLHNPFVYKKASFNMLTGLLLQAKVEAGDPASETFDPISVLLSERRQEFNKLITGQTIGWGPAETPHIEARLIALSWIDPGEFVNREDHRSHLGCSGASFSFPVDCTPVSDRVLRPVPEEKSVAPTVEVEGLEFYGIVKGARLECD